MRLNNIAIHSLCRKMGKNALTREMNEQTNKRMNEWMKKWKNMINESVTLNLTQEVPIEPSSWAPVFEFTCITLSRFSYTHTPEHISM